MEDKPYHERITDEDFRMAVEFIDTGNAARLETHLRQRPGLVNQHIKFDEEGYFNNPCLLNFVAENPVRHGIVSKNIVAVTRTILEAGAKQNVQQINYTLGLVSSGRVARECHFQIPLIDLLIEYSADPNGAMLAALAHGEFEAAEFLIQKGARISLPVAAATGRYMEFRALLPASVKEERRLSLAFAAQHGHAGILKLLLEMGEDPNRFNPDGAHMFSTPLHQAVIFGHEDIVKLLVEAGASLNLQDTIYHGTPLDWAIYVKNIQIENYLRSKM